MFTRGYDSFPHDISFDHVPIETQPWEPAMVSAHILEVDPRPCDGRPLVSEDLSVLVEYHI